jgi:hypothetical protein
MLGGALLMVGYAVVALARLQFPAWPLLVAESLAVVALIAGYRLIQNRAEGYAWSLVLQGAQLIQFLLPGFLYRMSLGLYLVIILSRDKTLISPGFKGELTVGLRGPSPGAIGINIVAIIMFFLLARAIRKQQKVVHAIQNAA